MFSCKIGPDAELRLLEARHAEAMFALIVRNRAHLDQWLRWSARVQTLEDTRAYIKRFLQKYADNDGFHAGIWHEGRLCGGLVCHYLNWDSSKSEIGYWLAAEMTGRGLVTRASSAALEYLFGELKMHRVEILCGVDNLRSRAVPERLDFTLEGIKRESEWVTNRYVDHVLYAMLAHEYTSRK